MGCVSWWLQLPLGRQTLCLLHLELSTEGHRAAVSVLAGDPRPNRRVSTNQRCVHWLTTFRHLGAAGLTQPETLCMLSIINWLWWNLLFKQRSSVLKTKILDWLGSFLSNILNWKLNSFLNEDYGKIPWIHKACDEWRHEDIKHVWLCSLYLTLKDNLCKVP